MKNKLAENFVRYAEAYAMRVFVLSKFKFIIMFFLLT